MSPCRDSRAPIILIFCLSVSYCTTSEESRRLTELKSAFEVKELKEPEALLQGLTFAAGQEVSEFVVLGIACEPFEGVVYRLGRKGEGKTRVTATIRLYRTHQEAIDNMLLKHGSGYAERPKRGSHHGKKDIGDFSLATTGTLTFVTRNATVSLVGIDAEVNKLDQLANEMSTQIDKIASAEGKQKVVVPNVSLKFDRTQETGREKTVVSLSVPNDVEFSWKVLPSEGKAEIIEKQAIVKTPKGQPTQRLMISVVTKDGFVFDSSHTFEGSAK